MKNLLLRKALHAVICVHISAFCIVAQANIITTSVSITSTSSVLEDFSGSESNVGASSSVVGNQLSGQVNMDGTGFIEGGFGGSNGESGFAEAQAIYSIDATNSSGVAASFEYDFLVTGLSFDFTPDIIFGAGGNPLEDPNLRGAGVRFRYEILLDNLALFSSSVTIFGDAFSGYTIEDAQNVEISRTSSSFSELFEIADISGTLELGTFAADATFNIRSRYSVEYGIRTSEAGGIDVIVNDPVALDFGTLRQISTQNPPEPVNAPETLFLLTLGAMGIASRKKFHITQ